MRIGILVAVSVGLSLFSGCSSLKGSLPAPCGVNDYIECPVGTSISGVPLPTNEGKTYTIITPKKGFWISQECDERIGR